MIKFLEAYYTLKEHTWVQLNGQTTTIALPNLRKELHSSLNHQAYATLTGA